MWFRQKETSSIPRKKYWTTMNTVLSKMDLIWNRPRSMINSKLQMDSKWREKTQLMALILLLMLALRRKFRLPAASRNQLRRQRHESELARPHLHDNFEKVFHRQETKERNAAIKLLRTMTHKSH